MLGWLLLLLGYVASRLINLTKLPIFTDEAIYIRWSQIGAQDANWRFISLTDGKQPLFTWVVMALLRIVPGDPLFVGRLASVLTGAVSLVGMWFLAWELFRNRRVALFASILYLVSPFVLMYDRMALYDSMVATFYIWNLYLAIRLIRELRLDLALMLGMTLGAGMLNKTSGFISLYLLPFTLLLFDFKNPKFLKRLCGWVVLVGIAAMLSQIFYSILRLSPFFHMISQKDSVFIYPFSEWKSHPFLFLQGNLNGLFDWLRGYMTLPLFAASVASFFMFLRYTKEKLLLFLFWIVPFVGLALFGRVLYPRFILFMTLPLFILAALLVDGVFQKLKPILWKLVAFGLFFFVPLITDYYIITDPLHAPIPYADKGQYIDNWPAGWGVPEVNAYLQKETKKGKTAVFTEGTFGLLPAAIEMYFIGNKNIEIKGVWPLPEEIPAEITDSAAEKPTYFVLNQTQKVPSGWPLRFIFEFQKGNRHDRKLRFYEVVHEEE